LSSPPAWSWVLLHLDFHFAKRIPLVRSVASLSTQNRFCPFLASALVGAVFWSPYPLTLNRVHEFSATGGWSSFDWILVFSVLCILWLSPHRRSVSSVDLHCRTSCAEVPPPRANTHQSWSPSFFFLPPSPFSCSCLAFSFLRAHIVQ
jgi:hypothetical protein